MAHISHVEPSLIEKTRGENVRESETVRMRRHNSQGCSRHLLRRKLRLPTPRWSLAPLLSMSPPLRTSTPEIKKVDSPNYYRAG